jgi:hypothetical protein
VQCCDLALLFKAEPRAVGDCHFVMVGGGGRMKMLG